MTRRRSAFRARPPASIQRSTSLSILMTTEILIIDEDPAALERYRETLAPKSAHWSVTCISSAEEAVARVREQAPDLVIAALAVNQGQGAQLLSEIEAVAPNTQRFITATAEDRPKLEATFGSAFQFLPTSCPADRLITEIQRCVAIDTWLGNARVKQLVAKMGEFPSLPPIYLKVVNALNSRDASAAAVAQAISGDLAISAKVLQTVNSSYYGFDEKVSNITQAVGILGIDCVKTLVLAIQVFSRLGRTTEQKALTDQLWHHSMSVAVIAKRVAEHETGDEKAGEEAYSAGLMHDIGKLVLLNAAPEPFKQARDLARQKAIPLWQAENVVIGCNHAETGAYLLARWGMPANLTEAVALHHEPINSFGKRFSALAAVHIANALVWERQSPEHPDAVASEAFLAEIGKASAWKTWQAVATGKTVEPDGKKALSLKKSADPEDESHELLGAAAAEANKNEPSDRAAPRPLAEDASAAKSRRLAPLFTLAACLAAAAAGIYFIATPQSPETLAQTESPARPEPAPARSSLASSLHKARDLSGISQSEAALQEIFDSQEATTPTEPSPAALATNESPETPPSENGGPPPKAQPEPQIAQSNEPEAPAESFPKPKLAQAEDSFPPITLSGIFYNKDAPLASVNGGIRRVGDTVAGAQIVSIEQGQILVRYQKELRSFKLD